MAAKMKEHALLIVSPQIYIYKTVVSNTLSAVCVCMAAPSFHMLLTRLVPEICDRSALIKSSIPELL